MGMGMRANAGLRRSWRGGSASLNYTLNLRSGTVGGLYSDAVHTVGGSFFLGAGGKWNCYTYFGYGLDTGRANLYCNGQYHITKLWRIRANYSFYRYSFKSLGVNFSSDTTYLKVGVYRPIGPYEVGLAWSPMGRQYGFRDGKRIWLEVGAAGF